MRVFYDNYNTQPLEDEIRAYLFDEYCESRGWETENDVPEELVWDYVEGDLDAQHDDLVQLLSKMFDQHTYIIVGTCGRWDGRYRRGRIITRYADLSRMLDHLDYLRIYEDDNGDLHIDGEHHDGSDDYHIRRLTQQGDELLQENNFETERELHYELFENYSQPVWLSEEMY